MLDGWEVWSYCNSQWSTLTSKQLRHPQPTHNRKPTLRTISIHLKPPSGWLWYTMLILGFRALWCLQCRYYLGRWKHVHHFGSMLFLFEDNLIPHEDCSTRALSSKISEFMSMWKARAHVREMCYNILFLKKIGGGVVDTVVDLFILHPNVILGNHSRKKHCF